MRKLALTFGGVAFTAIGALLGILLGPKAIQLAGLPIRGNPVDSPVVVRGGSFTTFTNLNWQVGSNGILFVDTGATPDLLSLDGVDPVTKSNPRDIIANGNSNWLITLQFRNRPTFTKLFICTQLSAAQDQCAPNPSGTLTGTKVYLQPDTPGLIEIKDLDQTNKRVHFTQLPNCQPSSTDLDPVCHHIDSVTLLGTGNDGIYHCVDGACDIGITHQ